MKNFGVRNDEVRIKTVTDYLDSLGVDQESIMYDNFG